jgi:hypothetical protein
MRYTRYTIQALLDRWKVHDGLRVFHRHGKAIGDFRKAWSRSCTADRPDRATRSSPTHGGARLSPRWSVRGRDYEIVRVGDTGYV